MPHSQKPSEADFHRSSDGFEDVSFLRLPEVKAVTGLSKTSIYELVRDKSFPAPVCASARRAVASGSDPKSGSGLKSAYMPRDLLAYHCACAALMQFALSVIAARFQFAPPWLCWPLAN